NHRKDGTVFWNRLLISPVFDGDGALTYFFASQFGVTLERDRLVRLQRDRGALETEAQRRAEELTRSEARLRFMLQAGGFGTWSLDPTENRFVASEVCRQTFARPPPEPFSYDDLLAAVFPADRERLRVAT
ncbi:histidine kinase, partial [Methylobacterium sp. A54F]